MTGEQADGTLITENLFPTGPRHRRHGPSPDTGLIVSLSRVEGATIVIAEQDPGAYIVWLAFGSLIAGLLISFYLPRRRVWTRVGPDGELWIVGRSDRYVDFEGEFGRLLDDLVRARPPAEPPGSNGPGTDRPGTDRSGPDPVGTDSSGSVPAATDNSGSVPAAGGA